MGQAAEKIAELQKLTAGAKARKECRSGEVRSLDSRGRAVPTRAGYPGSALEWLHGERLSLRGLRGMERDHGG
jgi:hypothetical protein